MVRAKNKYAKKTVMAILGIFLMISLLLPYIPDLGGIHREPSYYRRSDLLNSAYRLVSIRPWFGVGYGTSTAYIDKYLPLEHDLRFAQPPHHIFVLLLVESGALALLFFSLFIFGKLRESAGSPVLFISLIQMLFLACFDHYFFSMHQAQFLWWFVLGFV
jgi:O-antigen ligase